MQNYKYKFSVVIPIYNVEKYLEETIQSVIEQSIGFKQNIQIILVNDGSPDNSEKICLKYKGLYPENIIYIKQENAGVSSARNKGMEYIDGEYVNFLDSDDKWNKDAFEKVDKFFEKNKDNIDVVACRKKYFEAKNDYHMLDYEFKENKIVDIFEDYKYCHLHVASSFIKSEIARKYKFSTNLKYGEDAEYISKVILEKEKYGILSDVIYNYRSRLDGTSALQNNKKSIDHYIKTLEYFHESLIKASIEKYDKVIPYIQYLLMYDLQWRIKTPFPEMYGDEFKKQYIDKISNILQYIDDKIINQQKFIYSENKFYALELKYRKDISEDLVLKHGKLYFENICITNNISLFKIDLLDIKNGILRIEGRVKWILPKEYYNIYIKTDSNKKIEINLLEENSMIYGRGSRALDKQVLYHYPYKIEIPIKDLKKIKFMFKYKDQKEIKLMPNMGKFSKLCNMDNSYYIKENKIIVYKNEELRIINNSLKSRTKRMLLYAKALLEIKKYDIIWYRLLYRIINKIHRKPIWLISDRDIKANDNGEHLFKYIVNQHNKDIDVYFVIDKESEDYKKIKKIGKVIKLNTLKHKIYFLMASKVISSQANDYVINAYQEDEKYIKDLYNFDFVFLQHGVTKDDLSRWLNKWSKDIKIFVTAGKPEYNSIVDGNYGYTKDEVKLTGFPRHDALLKKDIKEEKKIVIIPTWRQTIVGSYDDTDGKSVYLDTFKDTEYFKFYNGLINDNRLIEALKETGYKCKFCLHPTHCKQYVDFQGNDYVQINQGFVDYQKEFKEAKLLVTDYSSVFFDFAYLRKPVIYAQFDKEKFFNGEHVYDKGYFDYEKDGFGPVCYDYEKTLQTIIEYLNNDCKIKNQYLEKIDKFYAYNDDNNCKRVYEEILKLKTE